ncbi:FkbM family methyltransferase [Candidatus Pelagibacter sp.]|nr:FkbM family methyltransferase [Candidatus Pelagibacter sp.]
MIKTNFYQINKAVKIKKLNHSDVLSLALEKKAIFDDNKDLLIKFINHVKKFEFIPSQLYQDVFASFIVGNRFDKTFLEFGATNGLSLSNSWLLEAFLGWKGVLAEPDYKWFSDLKKNRPNTEIVTECVWSKSGEKLNFWSADIGELSTINDFKENGIEFYKGNVEERKKAGKNLTVNTISLNDLIDEKFKSKCPSYISMDTEGSEVEILKNFNFNDYRPIVFTIEHSFTVNELEIDKLMYANNYLRIFKNLTLFDAWYVEKKALDFI